MNNTKDISVEYAHIYTNNKIGEDQKLSVEILRKLQEENKGKMISLVVMIDDYSFPDPSFDYESFSVWLGTEGLEPDLMLRESQLIPLCDEVLKIIEDGKLKDHISGYIRNKKYPCSLFIATWYLLRLGRVSSSIFDEQLVSKKLINILPVSFKPFEDKALEIIEATKFSDTVNQIENRYFEGRMIV